MNENIIIMGAIYKLNEKYNKDYSHVIISYDMIRKETIVELYSNRNNRYNVTKRMKRTEPLKVCKEYQ